MLVIILLAVVGAVFWFLIPSKKVIVNDQKQTVVATPSSDLDKKLVSLENKLNSLESSNSALQSKVSQLEGSKSKTALQGGSVKKSPVLIPINPGGSAPSTTWLNLNSGSITIDSKDYAGYRNAYLIINLSVFQGQGKAFARIVNTSNGLSILDSEVSTSSDTPVRLTSKNFKLPEGSETYTIQLKTLVEGYPAQAADSFLQITY